MPPNNFPSLRASCDRCRFHKLKCIVNTEDKSGQQKCERCTRAKVGCVYSQRARAKRQRNLDSEGSSGEGEMGPPTPPKGSASTCTGEEPSLDTFGSFYPDSPDIWAMLNSSSSDFDVCLEKPGMVFGSLGSLGQIEPANASELHVGSVLDTMPNQVLGNGFTMEPTTPKIDQATVLDSSAEISYFTHECTQSGNPDSHGTSPIARLSTLMADIYKALSLLTANCHDNRLPSFDLREYPIGTVIHLARSLIEIVRQFTPPLHNSSAFSQDVSAAPRRSSTASTSPFSSSNYYKDLQCITPPSSTIFHGADKSMDQPTRILAMSCYFSLRRLYCLVLTHFESYLRMLHPVSFPGGLIPQIATGMEYMQLGELPLSDEVCSKIDTAVKLMLDALHSAEGLLGLPSYADTMRRCQEPDPCGCPFSAVSAGRGQDVTLLAYKELAEAFKDSSAIGYRSNGQINMDNLNNKVESIKAILKDRIDL